MKVGHLAVVAGVLAAAAPARAEAPLTLEGAIRLALTRNERAAISDLGLAVAEADLGAARARFLPVVDVSAAATYRRRLDPRTRAEASLSVSQPLLVPSAFALYSQARHALEAQRATRAEERRLLAFDTANAYMAVLLAEQVVQAAQRKVETAKVNLATTDAQVKAQLVSSNDVTRAQIGLATATRDLAAGQGNLDAAHIELQVLINAEVPGELASPAELLAAGQRPQPATGDVIARSIVRRADLVANKELARAAHAFAREPKLRFLPTFELGGQLTATTPAIDDHALDAIVAVTARWTLFDAGTRTADLRARTAQATAADLETSRLTREIAAQVRSAALVLASRQQALSAAGAARDAARRGADEAAILYKQGLAKAIELVDANDQRFIAEVNYATSEFDVARAYLLLRLAMGLQPLEGAR